MRIALLIEHPTWSTALVDRAHERGLDLTPIDVTLPLPAGEFDLWVNRVNAMPSAGRPASVVAATGHLLLSLEMQGQRVVNGSRTHQIGGSKTAQAALFRQLGLGAPDGIDIFDPSQAAAAAEQLGFPVLTKPNIGGSGSGIMRHNSAAALASALDAGLIDLGIDGTGLVQRVIESADGMIHRVEMLGTDFFYGTEQPLQADAFNYCAADGCSIEPGESSLQLFRPSDEIVEQVASIMTAAQTDVGGVEYLIDASNGQPVFYDFNPYSNFVSGFDDELGFSPTDRYLDFVLSFG